MDTSAESAGRSSERDVYTTGKALGLDHMATKKQQIKATISPKMSPYFAPSGRTKTLSRKRKASSETFIDERESLKRSESLKNRQYDNEAADGNTVELNSINLPRDRAALPTIGELARIVDCFKNGTVRHEDDKHDLNVQKATMWSVERTKEATDVRRAAKKRRRKRDRVEHAVRSSQSTETGSTTKSSETVAKTEAKKYSPTVGEGAANKVADKPKAAEPINNVGEGIATRKRISEKCADLSKDGHEPKSATNTPIIPAAKERMHTRLISAVRRSQSQGFQSPMIR
jgi:hypothetical protein